jgi:4-amino-4-deoxy-L-arabinose transferase-like glycosyltransferase
VVDGLVALAYDPVSVTATLWINQIRPRPESDWPRMRKPSPPNTLLQRGLARLREDLPGLFQAPSLWRVLEAAFAARVLAACVVQWYVDRGLTARICVFPDAEYYWALAGTIRGGTLYEIVEWGDIPHFALRTPGYPLFLAACRTLLGEHTMGVRLAQAGLGVVMVWLVYRLTREVMGEQDREPAHQAERERWPVPLIAAALVSVHPYLIVMSVLVLSEAVFVPIMLGALWGLAILWKKPALGAGADVSASAAASSRRLQPLIALAVGIASGAAILVRPSWAMFVPIMLGCWCIAVWFGRTRVTDAVRGGLLIVLALAVVMAPWWIRNAGLYGRFVPTALWMGASLYDGLNTRASGASDMSFLEEPEIWPLDELDQDAELTRRALGFVRAEPGRTLELAIVKLARYWSPWPNAEGIRSPVVMVASALITVPLLGLIAVGLWNSRGNARAWVLLAGPLFYFCALHMVFASSMRYRVPAEAPAMGLAAVGLSRLAPGSRAGDRPSGK